MRSLEQSNPPRYWVWRNWSDRSSWSSWNSRNSRNRKESLLIYYKSRSRGRGRRRVRCRRMERTWVKIN